jgi:hypothetical protein
MGSKPGGRVLVYFGEHQEGEQGRCEEGTEDITGD